MPLDPVTGAALATGAASFLGGVFNNRSSAREAERNRRFTERMSSTAAQRSVEDYRRAGLNPALAYERTASTPGGSVAQFDDPVGKGISSGMQARELAKQLELADATIEKTRFEAKSAEKEALIRENTWQEEVKARLQESRFRQEVQPVNMRIRLLDEVMQRYSVPGMTRSLLSWLRESSRGVDLPPGMQRGRGPAMKFESALPSVNKNPSPYQHEMRR